MPKYLTWILIWARVRVALASTSSTTTTTTGLQTRLSGTSNSKDGFGLIDEVGQLSLVGGSLWNNAQSVSLKVIGAFESMMDTIYNNDSSFRQDDTKSIETKSIESTDRRLPRTPLRRKKKSNNNAKPYCVGYSGIAMRSVEHVGSFSTYIEDLGRTRTFQECLLKVKEVYDELPTDRIIRFDSPNGIAAGLCRVQFYYNEVQPNDLVCVKVGLHPEACVPLSIGQRPDPLICSEIGPLISAVIHI